MSLCAKWNLKWVAVLMVFGAFGCVQYKDRPLSVQDELDYYMARTLDSNDLAVYMRQVMPFEPWPLVQWGVSQLTLAAFLYNPDLEVARAHWAVTDASVTSASQRPNPAIGLAPGYNTTTGKSGIVSPWILGIALDIPLETAHKRKIRTAQAKCLSEAARLEIAQTAWSVRHQVREALLTLYAETQMTEIFYHQWQLQQDRVRFLTQCHDVGEVSGLVVSQARIEQEKSHADWLKSGRNKDLAIAQLARAIGVSVASLDGIEFDFQCFEDKAVPELTAENIQCQALLNRADLLAALAEYQASQYALQQQIAMQYPDLQIGPGYEFDQSEDKWSLGVSLTLPVFNRNQAEIAVARADRQEAAARFQAIQAEVLSQVSLAVMQYRASVEALRSSQGLLKQMAVQTTQVENMVQVGEALELDRLNKDLAYHVALMSQLEARIAMHRVLSQIEDVMQMPTDLPGADQNMHRLLTVNQGESIDG